MILRKAKASDFDALCELYQTVSAHMESEGEFQWVWGRYPSAELVRHDLDAGLIWCLYGKDGMAVAVTVDASPQEDYAGRDWLFGVRPGVFHRMAVRPDLRREGLGRKALADVETLLIQLGCDSLRCDCYEDNTPAIRFYVTAGMRQAGRAMLNTRPKPFLLFEKRLTEDCPLLPQRMRPAFRGGKLTPWGGDKLLRIYDKPIRDIPTGESLEISAIPDLESRSVTGVNLTELIRRYGQALVGKYDFQAFPLLLKLIDAKEPLSVQVHPDDAYARANEHGKLGKTEAWLILDAPKDAELVYGIKPGTSLSELKEACEQGAAVEPLLRRVKVKAGDVCYIPSGCVHAISAGIMLYEIQQSSDITYRFYDWDRVDKKGKRRELHLRQALDVTDLNLVPEPVPAPDQPIARVLDKPHFTLDLLRPEAEKPVALPQVKDFAFLTVLEGDSLTLSWEADALTLAKGESLLIPASAPALKLNGKGFAAVAMPK